jgi:hypothetical protein
MLIDLIEKNIYNLIVAYHIVCGMLIINISY